MTPISSRCGALSCALVLLVLSAGCGAENPIVAPTDARLTTGPAVQGAELTPGTDNAGPPALTFFSPGFRYTSPAGSYTTDPATWVPLAVVAGQPVTVNWFARARGGARVHAYQWALDIEDVFDRSPRVNEATDLAHWSLASPATRSATVGPFAAGEKHLLYIEVTDSHGLRSLGIVQLQVGEGLSAIRR